MGNDLLTTLVLATTDAPVAVSPAMNQQMYSHPATQENIATLKRRGCGGARRLVEQAMWRCRYGPRMLEPMQLYTAVKTSLQPKALAVAALYL